MESPEVSPEYSERALTSIHDAYTLATANEVDAVMISHFLNTLAEIALAVASRKAAK